MKIHSLDHVNLRTSRLDEMTAWYVDVLDLRSGERPDFAFPGAWIYAEGQPIIHLVEVAEEQRSLDPKIEHFALGASGFPDVIARLKDRGIAHTVDPVPGYPIVQINLHDPDGNHIHIDFSDKDAGLT